MTQKLEFEPAVLDALRTRLTGVVDHVIEAVMRDVPAYSDAWQGPMGKTIATAVRTALDGFLTLATRTGGDDIAPMGVAIEGAYALGRGEARSGRSMDALLAAYRIGARESWSQLAEIAVEAGLDAGGLARYAELVFAYIDELSAASVAGHSDELEKSGRVRQRYRDHLARQLVGGATTEVLAASAERADWAPPRTLTAVLVPAAQARPVLGGVDERTLQVDVVATDQEAGELVVLLVPDVGRGRRRLLRIVDERSGVVGPTVPWEQVHRSHQRVLRAVASGLPAEGAYDTDVHLAELALAADPELRADLRAQVLAPLADVRPSTRENLEITLREWLLHLGRRDAVAEALFVHPQTVRYRMGQLRELYGDRLDDPAFVRDAVVALA